MAILKTPEGTYEGTFDVHEPRWPEAVVTDKTREIVERKMRQEFADRLEKLTYTASLLRELTKEYDWYDEDVDSVVVERIPDMFRELAEGLRELRDNEPALLLCAERTNEGNTLTLEDGTEIEPECGKWDDSKRALVRYVARVHHGGAAEAALRALSAAGVRGADVAETIDYLGDGALGSFYQDAADKDAIVAAHVRVIVRLAGTDVWKNFSKDGSAYYPLLTAYRDMMKRELMSPKDLEAAKRRDRAVRRAADVFVRASERASGRKGLVAAKTVKRPRKRRAA